MQKVYSSSKWREVKDCGESVSELIMWGRITRNYMQYSHISVFLPFVHVF